MYNYGPNCANNMMGAYNNPLVTPANLCNFHYYRYVLASKVVSLFKTKQPDHWPEYLIWWLVIKGWFAVIKHKEYGKIPILGSLFGAGIWEQPTHVTIATPLVHYPEPLKMGEEVECVRLTPFYDGAMHIINHYAQQMALADDAINANLVNSRIGHVFGAATPTVAKSIKTVFDQISRGEVAVVDAKVTANMDGEAFAALAKPGDHVITGELLENQRVIYRNFCKDVGIKSGNEDKAERLTTTEVQVGEEETQRLISYWLRTIKSSVERVNNLFELELEVSLDEGDNTGRPSDDSTDPANGNAAAERT